jgi:hypothetical protein
MKQVLIESFANAFLIAGGAFAGSVVGILIIIAYHDAKDWIIHLFKPRVGLRYPSVTLSGFGEIVGIALVGAGLLFGIIVLISLGINTLRYIFSLI